MESETVIPEQVLITGGTGSLGRALTRRLLRENCERIVIFSRDEYKQYEMQRLFSSKKLRFVLGDVRDYSRLRHASKGIDTIIHAAALKHVALSEYNPEEFIDTNIGGTRNVVKAAIRAGCRRIILVSSDKAVSPINLYGATKLTAEKLMIAANNITGKDPIAFSVVRYGNVLNSRGSVYERYMELTQAGATALPVRLGSGTRFFWTLDDSVAFIIRCIDIMVGGEIFIPKLKSATIETLVHAFNKQPTWERNSVPGEKVNELMFTDEEFHRMQEQSASCLVIRPQAVMTPRIYPETSAVAPADNCYASSFTAPRWSVDDLRVMIKRAMVE